MVAWVCATFQSSGTGGTTCAAISFLTSRLPTCGPVAVGQHHLGAGRDDVGDVAGRPRAIASRCASGVAEPSGPVMALPPRAITTRRAAAHPPNPSGRFLSGEVPFG